MAEDDNSEKPPTPPKRNVLREFAEGQKQFTSANDKLLEAFKDISPLRDALTKNSSISHAMKAISESSGLGKLSEMMKAISPPDLGMGLDRIKLDVIQHQQPRQIDLEALRPPPNPIYDTNEKLELLIEQTAKTNELLDSYVKQSAALLSSLNDSIMEVASATALEAKTTREQNALDAKGTRDQNALDAERTRKQNTTMIRWAMWGVLVTAAFSVWGVVERNRDISTKELQTTISEGMASLATATQERQKANDKAVEKLSGKVDGLSKTTRSIRNVLDKVKETSPR